MELIKDDGTKAGTSSDLEEADLKEADLEEVDLD
jgi:hypothetical protein